jgi:hypothetical protein
LERDVPTLAQNGSNESWNRYHPEGGSLERDVPTLALHGINGESAGNNHLINEESTEVTGFRRELPAHRRGIHTRKKIPPGITSLFTRIQASKIAENSLTVTITGSAAPNH